jgi:hypothetical protein
MRPERKNFVRQQSGQGDPQSAKPESDEHISDQTGMPADIEIIHARMAPPAPDFFKQKLLPSP